MANTKLSVIFIQVLRLSAATQDLPKSVICNVHGVNPKFLKIGEKVAAERELGQQAFSKGAYFLGKMVWAKGYRELIDLLEKHKNDLDGFKLDVFGNGEDAHEVQTAAKRLDLNLNFLRGRDHADDSLHGQGFFRTHFIDTSLFLCPKKETPPLPFSVPFLVGLNLRLHGDWEELKFTEMFFFFIFIYLFFFIYIFFIGDMNT